MSAGASETSIYPCQIAVQLITDTYSNISSSVNMFEVDCVTINILTFIQRKAIFKTTQWPFHLHLWQNVCICGVYIVYMLCICCAVYMLWICCEYAVYMLCICCVYAVYMLCLCCAVYMLCICCVVYMLCCVHAVYMLCCVYAVLCICCVYAVLCICCVYALDQRVEY